MLSCRLANATAIADAATMVARPMNSIFVGFAFSLPAMFWP